MKLFECQNCGQLVYFENTQCERCGKPLGFLSDAAVITALDDASDGGFTPFIDRARRVAYCSNHQHNACNWLVELGGDAFCRACQVNRTIPDLSLPENLLRWTRIELAKHRLVYSLTRLGLPVENKINAPDKGLAFDFLAPLPGSEEQSQIVTGHDHGEITLNVLEADDSIRAGIRAKMGEPYRTLLGHLRHEIAHYYFERIVEGADNYPIFLSTFGDETASYEEALKRHYAEGAPTDWQERHISSYASTHPHEDWAETFAHYLHMIDTLETGYVFGLRVRPRTGHDDNLAVSISADPYEQDDFAQIIEDCPPLTFAVNGLNRSMGVDDLYPFVIAPTVIEKLKTVHRIVRNWDRTT